MDVRRSPIGAPHGSRGPQSDARDTARLSAREVLPFRSVDADDVANVDEHRYLHLKPSLTHDPLRRTGRCITQHSQLRVDHLQLHRQRHLDAQDLVFVHSQRDLHAVLEEARLLSQELGTNLALVIGTRVHKVVELAVIVEVLSGGSLDIGVLNAVPIEKVLGDDRTCAHVAYLGSDDSIASSRLVVLVLQDLIQYTVKQEGRSLPQFIRVNHLAPLASRFFGLLYGWGRQRQDGAFWLASLISVVDLPACCKPDFCV